MKYLILILGVLFILTIFNVGESYLKRLQLRKSYVLGFLILEIICLFLPTLQISSINFSIAGFLVPAVISIMFLGEIKNSKYFGRMLISFLTVVLTMQLIFINNGTNVFASELLNWTLIYSLLGIFALITCYYPNQAFVSLFLGTTTAEIIFYLTRYGVDDLVLGNEISLFGLIVSSLIMLSLYNIYCFIDCKRKSKAFLIQNK
ncbi:MAG: hypothetical protein PHX09_02075 [Clostridia bacterium]|nr:hypothetical protein [Clostridia bacterium]MDD4685850.1 hypothetical protein [Clostridia bacterium]